MPVTGQVAIEYYCGVCTQKLTDATALFTSCGHFFCANNKCTNLKRGTNCGRCEQCGKQCDTGVLCNRGSAYDSRVRSFVFTDLHKEMYSISGQFEERARHFKGLVEDMKGVAQGMQMISEEQKKLGDIAQFRKTHVDILGENAAAQKKTIDTLRAEVKQLNRKNHVDMSGENAAARNKMIDTLKAEVRQLMVEKETYFLDSEKLRKRNQRLERELSELRHIGGRSDIGTHITRRQPTVNTQANVREHRAQPRAQDEAVIDVDGAIPKRNLLRISGSKRYAMKRNEKRSRSTPIERISKETSIRRTHLPRERSIRPQASAYQSWGSRAAASEMPSARPRHSTGRFSGGLSGDWQRRVSSVPRPSCTNANFRRGEGAVPRHSKDGR